MPKWSAIGVAVACATGLLAQQGWSQQQQPQRPQTGGVMAGMLTCDVASGWGFIFGSTRDLKCTYSGNRGMVDRYVGHIDKFGVDLGYRAGGVIAWAVVAPNPDIPKGALTGTYTGLTGGAAFGVGAGANLLVGSGKTISLQPLSVEGMAGVNVAAGIAQIDIKEAPEGTPGVTGQSSYGTGTGIASSEPASRQAVGAQAVAQPDPNNCGTPAEPKACPPMPRRPLNYYPANKP